MNLVGKVALCSRGIPGLITSAKGQHCHGINLANGAPWQATEPVIMGEVWQFVDTQKLHIAATRARSMK